MHATGTYLATLLHPQLTCFLQFLLVSGLGVHAGGPLLPPLLEADHDLVLSNATPLTDLFSLVSVGLWARCPCWWPLPPPPPPPPSP